MKLDINTLIVGFIGSLIGVFLSGSYGRLTTAYKLNRTRKIILNYFQAIAIPKCEKYIKDVKQGVDFVENFAVYKSEKQLKGNPLDYMPMFNSDLIKSINPETLLQTSYKPKTHSDLIEIAYTIDFLKSHMTYDKLNGFKEKVVNHLESKNLKNHELYEHLQICSFYQKLQNQILSDFELKIETASELNKEQKTVLKNLNGNSFFWTVKYIWKQ